MRSLSFAAVVLMSSLAGCEDAAEAPQGGPRTPKSIAEARAHGIAESGLSDQQVEYLRLHYRLLVSDGLEWDDAVVALERKGDLFTLELINDLLTNQEGIPEERRTSLETLAKKIGVPPRKDRIVADEVQGMLETAAYADLTCNPLEYRLPTWTIARIAEFADDPEIRLKLEEIRDEYKSETDSVGLYNSTDDRVREYARRVLSKANHDSRHTGKRRSEEKN